MTNEFDGIDITGLREIRISRVDHPIVAEFTGLAPIEDAIEVDPNFGYTVKSFEDYQAEMAACVVREMTNHHAESKAVDALTEMIENGKEGLMYDILLRAVGMSREEQSRALDAMGEIAESMEMVDRYDKVLVYRCISSALPIALNKLKEIKTKRHASASAPSMRARGNPIVGPRRAEVKGKLSVAEEIRLSKRRSLI